MKKFIYFNSRDTLFRIELSRIVYFEADRNYTTLHLSNGESLLFSFGLGIMKELLEKSLQDSAKMFVRIGKSAIININYVYQVNLLKQTLQLYSSAVNKLFTLKASKEALRNLRALYLKPENQ